MRRLPVPQISSSRQLTHRQLQLYGTIVELAHQGKPITLRILIRAMGIRSLNGIAAHLAALRRKGLISCLPRKCNTIRPLRRIELFPEFFAKKPS